MQIIVIGLNHNTATVETREKMAVKPEQYEEYYKKLLADERVSEACIVSTCNRVEYYIVTGLTLCYRCNGIDVVSNCTGMDAGEISRYCYCYYGTDAVKHIFSVASGLDSLVLGEPQIFGQIKDAFEKGKENRAMKHFLNRVAEFTLKVAKRVRTNTGISENPVSVSYAAVELAKKIFGDLACAKALIIGAGEMCELAAKHLLGSGIGGITVTNRTYAKAERLAEEFYGKAVAFEDFPDILHEADIIISSTGAPDCVVTADMIKAAMSKRKYKPMFFIDIAVPRDIDPAASAIEYTYIYDIDDLKSVVEANKKEREKEAKKAREMVNTAVEQFEDSMESLKLTPVIVNLRRSFEDKKNEELSRFCEKNKITDPQEKERLDYLISSTLNKILHRPLTNLKQHAADKDKYTVGEAIELIFGNNRP